MGRLDIPIEDLEGPKIDRRTTMKLLATAGVTGLAGCGSSSDEDDSGSGGGGGGGGDNTDDGSDSTSGNSGGTMTAAWMLDSINNLDLPMTSQSQFAVLANNIFGGPMKVNANYEIVPDMAENWSLEDDGKLIVLNFREGITHHNGDEFTAEDIKFSINRTLTTENPYTDRYTDIDEMVVVDDTTLEIHLGAVNVILLLYLTKDLGQGAAAVPKSYHEEVGMEEYQNKPISTGPFKIVSWEPGTKLELEAFEDYYDTDEDGNQLPYLDKLNVVPIPETATMVSALQSGEIDMANRVQAANAAQIEGINGVDLGRVQMSDWWAIAMNTTREPFDRVRVRQAFGKLLDPKKMVEDAQYGEGVPAAGPIPPTIDWAGRPFEEKDDTQNFDPEEGRMMLEEEGVDDLSFSMLTSSVFERWHRAARSQFLEHVPTLEISLDKVPQSEYWPTKGRPDLNYDMALSYMGRIGDPDIGLWNFYRHPDNGGQWNESGYGYGGGEYLHAERVDELLAQQRRETDQEKRAELLWEAEDLLIEDAIDLYFVHPNDLIPKSDRVKRFDSYPAGLRPFENVSLDR